jgi:hypothetical protein
MPFSVPDTLEVYPETKWNIACSGVILEMGGRMPRASQVRRMIFAGWVVLRQGILAWGMYSMG